MIFNGEFVQTPSTAAVIAFISACSDNIWQSDNILSNFGHLILYKKAQGKCTNYLKNKGSIEAIAKVRSAKEPICSV